MLNNIPTHVFVDGTFYILLIFSLITWTIILFKIWQFSKNSYHDRRFSKIFWDATNLEAIKRLPADQSRGPLARIAQQGFAWLSELQQAQSNKLKFQGNSHEELLAQTLRVHTQAEQANMESGLTILASIGSTAPFVGLFGTVLGIMNAMHDITSSGSTSLDVVAGPIGDALVATAIGIAVAVPAVLAYNFLLRRSKHHRLHLENFANGFLHVAFSK